MRQVIEPSDLSSYAPCTVIEVMQKTLQQLQGYGFPLQDLGQFWLLDPSDGVAEIEALTGRAMLANMAPSWDAMTSHPCCFEMVFVTDDSGYGYVFWIPRQGCDPELLKLCEGSSA